MQTSYAKCPITCVTAAQYSSRDLLPCLYCRFNDRMRRSKRRYCNFLAGAGHPLSTLRIAKRTSLSSSLRMRITAHNDCLSLSDFTPRRLWYPEHRNGTCLLHTFVSVPYVNDLQVLLNIKNKTVKNIKQILCIVI